MATDEIQFAMEETKILEAPNNIMTRPDGYQVRRDVYAYNSWKYTNTVVRITILCSM